MGDATIRKLIIAELHNRYLANGFITEDEALACFVAHKTPLSQIDSLTEHLLTLGVIFKTDEDIDAEAFSDRSKLDYSEIYAEVVKIEPGLEAFIKYVQGIAPPQHREAQNIIPQAKSGNQYARNRLIEMYLRTIVKQAIYYSKRFLLPLDDTIQDGVLGIITAIEKFDPYQHDKFSTYAPWWIGQSITRCRQLPTNSMRFSAQAIESLFAIQEAVLEHICEDCWQNDKIVCPKLAAQLGKQYEWTIDEASTYIFYHKQCQSLEDIDEDDEMLSDSGLCNELLFEGIEMSADVEIIAAQLQTLPEKEQLVISLRYGFTENGEMTLEEVGQIMKVTRERVRQIEAKALQRLRHPTRIKYLSQMDGYKLSQEENVDDANHRTRKKRSER
jgi:RNA polymerase primary sigma factor